MKYFFALAGGTAKAKALCPYGARAGHKIATKWPSPLVHYGRRVADHNKPKSNCLAKKGILEHNRSVAPCGRITQGLKHFVLILSTGMKPYTTGLFDGPLKMAKQLHQRAFSLCDLCASAVKFYGLYD